MYNSQIKSIQAQVPAIQQLYSTLQGGLQTQYDTNLASGVQSINEDASARGVLRSTLPNDARLSLTTQLGAALQQSLGQLGANQAKDIAGVNQQVGSLRIDRANQIASLARALETQDIEKQRLALDKKNADRQYKLQQAELAAKQAAAAASRSYGGGYSGGGGSVSATQQKLNLSQSLYQDVANAFAGSNAKKAFYTEKTVLPALYQAYGALGADAINKVVYQYRQNALGF